MPNGYDWAAVAKRLGEFAGPSQGLAGAQTKNPFQQTQFDMLNQMSRMSQEQMLKSGAWGGMFGGYPTRGKKKKNFQPLGEPPEGSAGGVGLGGY